MKRHPDAPNGTMGLIVELSDAAAKEPEPERGRVTREGSLLCVFAEQSPTGAYFAEASFALGEGDILEEALRSAADAVGGVVVALGDATAVGVGEAEGVGDGELDAD